MEGNEIAEHMQQCEALKDLYNKKDVPKIVNFYKVTEKALKNGADELKVYKIVDYLSSEQIDYKANEPYPSLNLFLHMYQKELLNILKTPNGSTNSGRLVLPGMV